MRLTDLIRPDIRQLSPYTPGEQVNDAIKLNTNESLMPASPQALAILKDFRENLLRKYPSPGSDALRSEAAAQAGLDPENVLVGNGSDDCLTILYRTLLPSPTGTVGCAWPTYGLYKTLAGIQGVKISTAPYKVEHRQWRLPVEELQRIDARLTMVANPNNPSGTLTPPDELLRLATGLSGILAVDEAYVDFAPEGSSLLPMVGKVPNLVVLRTFSKSYALAGLRLGLMYGPKELIQECMKVKDSYNVNALTQAIGLAALRDRDYHKVLTQKTIANRLWLEERLAKLGWSWPYSAANFLLCKVGPQAKDIYLALKAQGILIRWWDTPELREYLRITVGSDQDQVRLVTALESINVSILAR